MSNVKLAIRVRPFTERERKSDKETVSVVNVVDEHTVTITNIKVNASGAGDSRERVRSYHADYTFDSCCSTHDPRYAAQDKVFDTLGHDVLSSILRGVSACVLAYGQSATGKTHTMMGVEHQPGLVPRLCHALYKEQHDAVVTVSLLLPQGLRSALVIRSSFNKFPCSSFLEIYNERVHDLLAGEEPPAYCNSLPRRRGNARKDLRVREHPSRGTYVQNLRRVVVHDVQALLALVNEGAKRRRTAATRRNATSSRSHALLELATSGATLHLADLAGSEKASWEGCGGGRQKEGANINKSLVALSNVISALVNAGCGRGRFVPYRDSALTWLLKECFTGGARTFIIATVSPSVACYGESASTLRWAARARQLPEPKLPSVTAQSTRAALQAQLNRLVAELARHHIRYVSETGKITFEDLHWKSSSNKLGNLISENIDKMIPSQSKPEAHNSSTASSVASGSSDVLNTLDKKQTSNLTKVISKEMDKLFGPSLERARSGSDLKIVAPLKAKRRQYRSQEVLPIDKTLYTNSQVNQTMSPKGSQSQLNVDNTTCESGDTNKSTLPVPILYDNQRAEIVASVTERLYSKLKKKEENAVAKMESVVDKKIMEPLSELRICTNARQRLIDLSQKAMRNKRRIGIPAHTQTRKQVIRVKDQGVDVQTDLQPYHIKERDIYTPHQDVGTETVRITPRCKEIAVGPKFGSVRYNDTSTVTDVKVLYKNSFMMTDNLSKCDRCTQTIMIPPPRRKKRASLYTKYLRNDLRRRESMDIAASPVININISQSCPTDSETLSDEGISNTVNENKPSTAMLPPDLLTNHNAIELNTKADDETKMTMDNPVMVISTAMEENMSENIPKQEAQYPSLIDLSANNNDEFSDDDFSLPRVRPYSLSPTNPNEIEDMILGRNNTLYPYNIVLSPYREKDDYKRTVKFRDIDSLTLASISVASQTCGDCEPTHKSIDCSDLSNSEKYVPSFNTNGVHATTSSDSNDSSKGDSDTFIWKKGEMSHSNKTSRKVERNSYSPVYKRVTNLIKNRTPKTKIYREFLGLDKDNPHLKLNSSYSDCDDNSQEDFRQKRQFFEYRLEKDYPQRSQKSFNFLEKNIMKSCDKMEKSVNKYENYLTGCKNIQNQNNHYFCNDSSARTPREYLQHLVDIRKRVIKGQNDNLESSTDRSHSMFSQEINY